MQEMSETTGIVLLIAMMAAGYGVFVLLITRSSRRLERQREEDARARRAARKPPPPRPPRPPLDEAALAARLRAGGFDETQTRAMLGVIVMLDRRGTEHAFDAVAETLVAVGMAAPARAEGADAPTPSTQGAPASAAASTGSDASSSASYSGGDGGSM